MAEVNPQDLIIPGIDTGTEETGPQSLEIDVKELVNLCAVDSELYARSFFPKTFRQASPPFARDLWAPLEDPAARYVNLICFRGSSKTTRLRVFASKRIAYGVSRTILYVGASERDAIASVQWLRNQVDRNKIWAQTFGLVRGRKWEETQCEIECTKFGHTVWVLATGITGSIRGINFDDYRPDLIIIDDPQTDESVVTDTQREKTANLILGAVANSLQAETEDPNAKLAMAITPQHPNDISQQALKDPEWVSRVFPCWTRETLDLPVDQQLSSWPQRYPTEMIRRKKRGALARNKLSIFTREQECRLVSPENTAFMSMWLNIREEGITPTGVEAVLGIDPVPPPSEKQMEKGMQKKDWEAQYVWGRHNGQYHLLDYDRNRGHDPSWSIATAFRLARQWRVSKIVCDAVAYQRVLKWLLEQEMRRRRIYYPVIPIADGMQKYARITSVFGGLATHGLIWIGPEHTIFAEQFSLYGPTYAGFDDDIDASALAVQELSNPYLERVDAQGRVIPNYDDEDLDIRACP